jgi:hypothetical protein
MQTLVISYFCDVDGKTYYSDHGKRFAEECRKFNIPFSVAEIESHGSYQKNCLLKPKFIYSKLIEHQKPVLWLDIDTFIFKKPNIFDGFSSLGINIGVASTDPKIMTQIKASPLWFNYNSDTLLFVQDWIKQCDFVRSTGGGVFDHETFIGCLTKYVKEKKIAILDSEYCVWPGHQNENTVFMMGLSDAPSKKEALKKMGYSDDLVEWQSPGNSFMEVKS